MRLKTSLILFTLVFVFNNSLNADPVKMPEMVTIKASIREAPPSWAVMQRHLIKTIEEAAPIYIKKFTHSGGTLNWNGKLDDDYECFINWPLFYIIGGDDKFLDRGLQQYNAITRQWTYQVRKSVYKEFVKEYDSLHLTEGYVGFQHFGLADPFIPENVDRARRFAGFYLNEDPEAQNYDPQYKVIRSTYTGSKGPLDHSNGTYWLNWRFATLYPILKDLEWDWYDDPERREEILKLYDEMVTRCDTPLNLTLTGLVTNAYLYTGEEKYKKWVLEYVDAWMDRIEENNGIIPDNIGRTGKIGEYRNGQWWGGFFGWTSRYSLVGIFRGLINASECAHLLSGDPKYIDLLRSQVYMLINKAITRDGNILIPYKFGIDGWYDYRPLHPYVLSHIWHASLDTDDWEMIEKLRKGTKYGPWRPPATASPKRPKPGSELWHPDGTLLDWNTLYNNHRNGSHIQNEPTYLNYLAGINPDWPEKILQTELEHVCLTLERMKDTTYVHEWPSQTMIEQNPVQINGLRQVTMGGPPICFNGGLLRAQVRYFDIDRARPGLPLDVAALVKKIESNRTVVELVNTSAFETHNLIIQAGAYGEHEVTEVRFTEHKKDAGGTAVSTEKAVPVNKKFFAVELPPSTTIELKIGVKHFVNKPGYAFPWHN